MGGFWSLGIHSLYIFVHENNFFHQSQFFSLDACSSSMCAKDDVPENFLGGELSSLQPVWRSTRQISQSKGKAVHRDDCDGVNHVTVDDLIQNLFQVTHSIPQLFQLFAVLVFIEIYIEPTVSFEAWCYIYEHQKYFGNLFALLPKSPTINWSNRFGYTITNPQTLNHTASKWIYQAPTLRKS